MTAAARTASRTFLRSTPAASPSRFVGRSTRTLLHTQVRASTGRKYAYASEPPKENSSSVGLLAALFCLSSAASYFFLNSKKTPKDPSEATKEDYQKVYDEIAARLADETDYDDGSYGPVLVLLAWHASGTYDKQTGTGGSNGATMRFPPEPDHLANTGLKNARDFLEPVKAKFPWISYADLWTLAGSAAIQEMGGPEIPWRPGREDKEAVSAPPDGRLPIATKDEDHIRDVFLHMGFDDREMVALIGGHALGRAHKDRSGFDGPWDFSPTVFTNEFFRLLVEENWYQRKWDGPPQFTDKSTSTLMMLPTDMALIRDKSFRQHVERHAKDNDAFFKEFSEVWVKLLELGVPFKSKPEDRWVFETSN